MYSVENTWTELRDAGVDTAVLAFGAIEQHGQHLPIGTDWFIADAVAHGLANQLDAFLLPAMPFGNSREHMALPGTITLRPFTLAAVFEDIIDSLRTHGFKRVVVYSAHGGNWVLKPILRELNFRYHDISIVWADGILPERGDQPPRDIHAGHEETSAILHLRPDLVKDEGEHLDSPGTVGQEFNDYLGYDKTTKIGAWGLPSNADARQGEEQLVESVRRKVEYVRWAFDKIEELKANQLAESNSVI